MRLNHEIYNEIPRTVKNWSEGDVLKWFSINGIDYTRPVNAPAESIDGKWFLEITPEILWTQCEIDSSVMIKKILQWIEIDREQFQKYVLDKGQMLNSIKLKPQIQNKENQKEKQQIQDLIAKESNVIHPQGIRPFKNQLKKDVLSFKEINLQAKSPKKKENCRNQENKEFLSQQYVKFAKSSYEQVITYLQIDLADGIARVQENSSIGRGLQNKLIIVDDAVSRKHAEIIKIKEDYFLKDLKSKFGTFVEVGLDKNRPILEGDYYEIGENVIEIIKARVNKNFKSFELKIRISLRDESQIRTFFGVCATIGCNKSNDLWLPGDDVHDRHARFILCNKFLFLEKDEGDCYIKLTNGNHWKLERQVTRVKFGPFHSKIRKIVKYEPIPELPSNIS